MEVRLLGPVGLWHAGREAPLARSHRRCLLAILAMTPGQSVPSEVLIDRVWGDRPPREAIRSLYTHVSALRRLLGETGNGGERPALRRIGGGYVLEIDPDHVDVHRARQLAADARALAADTFHRDVQVVESLREACSLWQGTPLAGLKSEWAARVRVGLDQERLAMLVERFTVELRLGEHAAVVGTLAGLLADNPLVEPLASLLMLALYRCGRQADALDVYVQARERLVDELGDEPGPELGQLHMKILRRDPNLDLGPDQVANTKIETTRRVPHDVRPAQLPPDIAGFTGRVQDMQRLDSLLADGGDTQPTAVAISAIDGTAGVGKTALAVHWAHRVADRFPDGQLYADLRGFGSDVRPRNPFEVVRGFLEGLDVPLERMPASPDAQAGLYRSRLADRRMLIVLDNARDAEQVRPLLPGAASCVVVVTSRYQLPSLVAADGAHSLTLDVFTPGEARRLLERRLGCEWVAADPDATDEIIYRCAGLPLALAVVAAHAAIPPALSARALTDELREARCALDLLGDADDSTDLRAVFSWSYRALSAEAARLFRLLGLHPGPHFAAPAVACLAGVRVQDARRLLTELTRAHLVSEYVPGRYKLHDLLRVYAAELTRVHEADETRDQATERMLDFYLHTAHAAAMLLNPLRDPIDPRPPQPGVVPIDFDDRQPALAWLDLDYAVVLESITVAAQAGFERHSWQLAWAIADFVQRRGYWHDWAATQNTALGAAQRLGDPLAQALAHRSLAGAHLSLGSYDHAHHHLVCALDQFSKLGDRVAQARTHTNIGVLLGRQGRHDEALESTQRALTLYRAAGDVAGQAYALNGIGWLRSQLGDHSQALHHCQQALVLQRQIGDEPGQAATWDSLGYAYHHLGQHRQAAAAHEHALDLVRANGDRYREADVLSHLGDTLHAVGDLDAARRHWSQSLEILDQLNRPEATEVRAKLQTGPPSARQTVT